MPSRGSVPGLRLSSTQARALLRIARRNPREAWGLARLLREPGVTVQGGAWLSRPAAVAVAGAGRIEIGDRLFTTGRIELQARDRGVLVIGENVTVDVGARLAVACDARLQIGKNVAIGAYNFICAFGGDLTIGDWCMLGPHVSIYTVDHGTGDCDTPMRLQEGIAGDVVLEDDVWVGASSVVLKGVRIGAGAVVAAGAVVTTDVKARTVVGGVPARFISDRGTRRG